MCKNTEFRLCTNCGECKENTQIKVTIEGPEKNSKLACETLLVIALSDQDNGAGVKCELVQQGLFDFTRTMIALQAIEDHKTKLMEGVSMDTVKQALHSALKIKDEEDFLNGLFTKGCGH